MIATKFHGLWQSGATYVGTLHNPRTGFVVGGPAMVTINDQQSCDVAVFNAAPYYIQLDRGNFMGVAEELPSTSTEISSVEMLPVAPIHHQIKPTTVQPEELCNFILEHTPINRQEVLLQLLLQFLAVLKTSANSNSRLLYDDRTVSNQEPLYQKRGKIPQAHQPIIEETLDSWICLGLICKADSMFNTPLFCIQPLEGYPIVQDFRALNRKQHFVPLKFKKVHGTLQDIETSRPKIFSTLDLSDPLIAKAD